MGVSRTTPQVWAHATKERDRNLGRLHESGRPRTGDEVCGLIPARTGAAKLLNRSLLCVCSATAWQHVWT